VFSEAVLLPFSLLVRFHLRLPLLLRGLVAALALALLAPPAVARADDPLDEAIKKVEAAAKAQAEATAGFEKAWEEHERLEADAAKTEREIKRLEGEQRGLAKLARARAVQAYKGSGAPLVDELLADQDDLLDAARRATLLDRVNEQGIEVMEHLDAVTDDLKARRERLAKQRKESEKSLDEMGDRKEAAEKAYADAQEAERELRARLERERRLREYAEIVKAARARARAAAEAEAARRAAENGGGGGGGGGEPGQIIGSGSWICPVQGGVSFSNDWGTARSGGRSHKGTDMFAARGTPAVAPVPGSVFFQSDPLGGLAAYVNGNDGNTYYMAHLNDYVGGARNVAGGEVVGHVGNTGNAASAPPHMHFEIRVGGPNGTQINPYPTLAARC
jgi:murein DD-endopeptidase MepM/ murein hydrolase activator NlpD